MTATLSAMSFLDVVKLGAELHLLVRAYRFDDILDRVGRQ